MEDNWSEEATAKLSSVFTEKEGELYDLPKAKKAKATKVAKKPAAKKVKKTKKAPAAEEKTEEKPKVKKSQKDLIASLVADAAEDVVAAPANAEAKEPAPTVEAVTEQYKKMSVADEQVQEELEEEDDDDESDLEEISDSDEEDEVEYNADDVEDFSHSSRPDEKLFIDSEFRVWDEDQELVGTYNAATDTIF